VSAELEKENGIRAEREPSDVSAELEKGTQGAPTEAERERTAASPRPPLFARDADPDAMPPPIVFVGGTGRSGTHVVATLLGRHSHYANVRIEARFHVSPQGFPDLLAGRATPEQFVSKLRNFWWRRIAAGEPLPQVLPRLRLGRSARGLGKIMERSRLDTAVERFRRRWPRQPESACRRLFFDLLWPVARKAGKPGLVEMSCFKIAEAPTLLRLFPEARLVHVLRDGRDSGSSKVSRRQKPEHPRNAGEGVAWWLDRLRTAERGLAAVPPERVLALSLDDLAGGDRERSYRSLLEFLEIEDELRMRQFFDREVNADNANRGRWRRDLTEPERRELTLSYERALDEIETSGFRSAPILRDVYRRLG
jgi:hypothetical protein